jgi:hypothetical protein
VHILAEHFTRLRLANVGAERETQRSPCAQGSGRDRPIVHVDPLFAGMSRIGVSADSTPDGEAADNELAQQGGVR